MVARNLTDYQVQQLTNQSECYIHTHSRAVLDQTSGYELQNAQPVQAVLDGATLSMAQDVLTTSPSGGVYIVYLPPATTGKVYSVTQITTGTTVLTTSGSDTITGGATYSLTSQWQSVTLKSNGSGLWLRI